MIVDENAQGAPSPEPRPVDDDARERPEKAWNRHTQALQEAAEAAEKDGLGVLYILYDNDPIQNSEVKSYWWTGLSLTEVAGLLKWVNVRFTQRLGRNR